MLATLAPLQSGAADAAGAITTDAATPRAGSRRLDDVVTEAQHIVKEREAAAAAATRAQTEAARYAKELVAASVPVRDVAELLGLSFQRVSQLVAQD